MKIVLEPLPSTSAGTVQIEPVPSTSAAATAKRCSPKSPKPKKKKPGRKTLADQPYLTDANSTDTSDSLSTWKNRDDLPRRSLRRSSESDLGHKRPRREKANYNTGIFGKDCF